MSVASLTMRPSHENASHGMLCIQTKKQESALLQAALVHVSGYIDHAAVADGVLAAPPENLRHVDFTLHDDIILVGLLCRCSSSLGPAAGPCKPHALVLKGDSKSITSLVPVWKAPSEHFSYVHLALHDDIILIGHLCCCCSSFGSAAGLCTPHALVSEGTATVYTYLDSVICPSQMVIRRCRLSPP